MRKSIWLALLLILCVSGAAFAQDATPVFCGTLSQADCDILTQSHSAMSALDSVSFDVQVNATVTNAPKANQPETLAVTGNGSVSGLTSVRSSMMTPQTDPSQYLGSLLNNLNGDFTLNVTVPNTMRRQSKLPRSFTVEARLVDGFGYVNTDNFAEMMQNSPIRGWVGVNLERLLNAVMAQQPNMVNNITASSADMMQVMQQFDNPDFLNSFLTLQRTDDGSSSVATFETTIDYSALISNSQFQDFVRQQMQSHTPGLTDAQMQEALGRMTQAFQDLTMTITESIDTTTGYLQQIHGAFAFDASHMHDDDGHAGNYERRGGDTGACARVRHRLYAEFQRLQQRPDGRSTGRPDYPLGAVAAGAAAHRAERGDANRPADLCADGSPADHHPDDGADRGNDGRAN